MNKFYKHCCGLTLLMLFSITTLFAQQAVTGKVTDANGPLPGVTVGVPGTSKGTQTDAEGNYSIQVDQGEKIRFSMVGYLSQELTASGSRLDVVLKEDAGALDEVVVTAMGIKREKKSLGYAFQEVKSESLVEARENNLTNALVGKVSGLQITKNSSGPGASAKITLRGNNSLTGDNQPLIVVDGVPMENFTGAENNDFWNPSADMGNGLGDISPDDIESMSVLKGGAASALYGSRAGNGVILITTKSGRQRDGSGINYSATFGMENIFTKPDLQQSFGQGANGVFNNVSGFSWGPKVEGQEVTFYDGSKQPLRAYNNIDNFFKTGFSTQHNLSFQQQVSDATSLFTSANYLNDDSKIPGATLERLNLMTKARSNFGKNKRWTTDVKVQYIRNKGNNRPVSGLNTGNYYSTIALLPVGLNINDFKEGMDVLGAPQRWYNLGTESPGTNPYWAVNNKLNQDIRDRFLLNASVKYQFTDWLDADFRAGSDIYNTKYESKTYSGANLNNSYSTRTDNFNETNFIASLNARKDNLFGKWGGAMSLFGQIMKQDYNSLSASAGSLKVPNLFTITNSVGNPGISETITRQQINSLFGTAEINYDGYFFLNLTGRNDWSSTLSKANRSFFYPSVSASLVVTDMINKNGGSVPSWLNFAKVRGSYAQTGNSLRPYQLYNTYFIGNDPHGNTVASTNTTLYNDQVVSELIKNFEVGFDVRLFNNFNLDFSYYKNNATNQLLEIPMNPMSGYVNRMINAGNIQNEGIEIVLGANILNRDGGLVWDTNVNFSRNRNTIREISDELNITRYGLPGGVYDNIAIFGEKGREYGAIYGTKYVRVEDENSEFYGQRILTEGGLPQGTNDSHYLGSQAPNFLLGWTNSFRYKNFGFSMLIDGRFGGKYFSGTNAELQQMGLAAATVVNGAREDFVVDGVVSDGNGGFIKNTTAVTPQQYWNAVAGVGNLGIIEENIFDATNVRIRNIQLNYSLPKSMLGNSFVKSAKVSLSMNNVLMLKSYGNGVDPEAVFATSTNATGFEYLSMPTSRSYFFNLSFGF